MRPPLATLAACAAALVVVGSVSGADAPVVTITQTLPGLSDRTAGGYEPPDVQVAAGAGFVVEMVNLAEQVWSSGRIVWTRDLSAFWGSGDDRLTDPRIVFDAPSGRWFASISNVDRDSVELAVSTTSDPTGAWTIVPFGTQGCADQPRLGVDDGQVVLAADIFDGCENENSAPIGNEVWVINKQQLLDGSTTPAFTTSGPTGAYMSLVPATALSPSATEYLVSVDDRASRVVHLLAVDGVPPAPARIQEVATLPIAALLRPPPAGQPPGGGLRPPIATNDNRILGAVWENGRLWFTANGRCIPPGDVLIRSCGRVVELDTTTHAVTWDTDIARAGAHVFYPAVSPDGAGNVVIVAGASSTKSLPEVFVTARTVDGALTEPKIVMQSVGPYRGDRYGDYFSAARDPASPELVWVAGEAGTDAPDGMGWTTVVASAVVTPAGTSPPAVADATPPPVRAVAKTVRSGSSVKLSYRVLADGTAVRAVVTVKHGTSTVFQVSTSRTVVQNGRLYSVLWPARKLRGTFSFCVDTVSVTGVASPASCVRIAVRR